MSGSVRCPDFSMADHWRFSNETALRIPVLLHELCHRLRWHNLNILHDLKPKGSKIRMDFTRRVLTGRDNPDERKYQFTYSHSFTKFSTSRDPADLAPCYDAAGRLFTELVRNGSPEIEGWRKALEAFEKENHDETDRRMVARLRGLTKDSFSTSAQESDEAFESLTLLYEFYSRIPLKGLLVEFLDCEHFRPEQDSGADGFKRGRQDALAYLLQVDSTRHIEEGAQTLTSARKQHRAGKGPMPPIVAFWRIDPKGKCHQPVSEECKGGEQPPPRLFPPVEGKRVEWQGGIGSAPGSVASLYASLWTALWGVFNSEVKDAPPPEYHIAVPVYCSDELHEELAPKTFGPLLTQGAFLGWLFLSFPEEAFEDVRRILDFSANGASRGRPSWKSHQAECDPACGGQELAKELRRIRHVLSEFSDRYLLGEMEWALERDFRDGQDALGFTLDHYHHCDGWVGEPLADRELPDGVSSCYAAFFSESNGKAEFDLAPTNSAVWLPDRVTHLLVNVSHSLATACPSAKDVRSIPAQVVCLRRRSDTALCADGEHAHEYLFRVAETVRRMFAAATYLESVQEKEKSETLEDISHEVKHVVLSLRTKWLQEPDAELIRAIGHFFTDHGLTSLSASATRLCPFPNLIKAASRAIQLWTGTRDAVSLFDERPKSLEDVFVGLWATVTDSALALASRRLGLKDQGDIRSIESYQQALEAFWCIRGHLKVCSDGSVPLPGQHFRSQEERDLNADNWVVASKILLSMFTDVLKHADPEADGGFQVSVSGVDGVLLVKITDVRRRPGGNPSSQELAALNRALAASRFFQSTGHGKRVLLGLARDHPSFVFWSPPAEGSEEEFSSTVKFLWSGIRGKKKA